MTHVFELAQRYAATGYSVFPVLPHDKRPHFDLLSQVGWLDEAGRGTWEPANKAIAGPELLRLWFAKNGVNLAVVGGEVSGQRVFLDFDSREAYRAWGLAHKAIVNNTPVQRTAKGYHVVVQTPDCATGAIWFNGQKVGEVRGNGGYAVAPPSIHQTGATYTWLIDPFEHSALFVDDLAAIGLSRQAPQLPRRAAGNGSLRIPQNQVKAAKEALARLATWRRDDYHAWLAVGMALSELGETGRQLWHDWSAGSSKYDAATLDKTFDHFKRQDGPIITLGTLFWAAKYDDPANSAKQGGWRAM